MFSRKHPFLFSALLFTGMVCGTLVILSFVLYLSFGKPEIPSEKVVGIIPIDGLITDSSFVIQKLKDFRKNESVRAIVLHINSPGGAVAPSQEIYAEVLKTVKEKTVVASMSSVAASGGYYIASAANKIFANPGTITGSIGVIMTYTNVQELMEMVGLKPVVIKSGKHKDMASPFKEMSDDEEKIMKGVAETIHMQFIEAVADGREMKTSDVESLADGRIFTGETAKEHGLVDFLGGMEEAVEWAGRSAGIEGEIHTVRARKKRFSFLDYFTESFSAKLWEKAADNGPRAFYLYRGR
jgi:protease-4